MLSSSELTKLQQLLTATPIDFSQANFSACVVPRLGTISAWSSKATEMAKMCGLTNISRIEHGRLYVNKTEINYDPLTESVIHDLHQLVKLFAQPAPEKLKFIPLLENGLSALEKVDDELGLALDEHEKKYLLDEYQKLKRNPTDAELMMFAQINSEHCRHKIFNASWEIDGKQKAKSLFEMIRNTHKAHPDAVLSAYSDNAAVMRGVASEIFYADPQTKQYISENEAVPFVLKVETHNHPTAISPFPGAATGSGGEIRDELATGIGAKTKMGLCGFSVSHLNIPHYKQPWENNLPVAPHMATSLEIMLQGPLGAASFNNEFGRPNLCGYFRSFSMLLPSQYGDVARGYHKPIMIAGGLGQIRPRNVFKQEFSAGALLIVLGGPAMAIGLGGGAASSRTSSNEQQALDFASVQRSNPEMQRRAYEVIQTCLALKKNPILSIHDVGAGGLSNALPEIVEAIQCGALIQLRDIHTAEPGMAPLAVWCNEAQERFVLAIEPTELANFTHIAERERCPFAVVGAASKQKKLIVEDTDFLNTPIDLATDILFKKLPRLHKHDNHAAPASQHFDFTKINLADAVERVLQFPAVADKSFLITIGDRTVGGLTARDQFVGPWQIPVSDVAVCNNNFVTRDGQAMAMGERAPIALLHPAASARMAVGEAITNLAAARINRIEDIVLSANWMAAANYPGEGAALYDAVQAIGEELCPALGIAIPVGKDSLSMQTKWQNGAHETRVTSPLSLIITAAANVIDVEKTLTPQLKNHPDTILLLIDLSEGVNEIGGSVLLQAYNSVGERPADIDNPALLKHFFAAIQELNQNDLVLAYHDRSDGGLFITICEMLFSSRLGAQLFLHAHKIASGNPVHILELLFSEELGAVIQIKKSDYAAVMGCFKKFAMQHCVHEIGHVDRSDALTIFNDNKLIYQNSRENMQKLWSRTSYEIAKLRDNPECAEQEFAAISQKNSGLSSKLTFKLDDKIAAPYINVGSKPKVAILREQGVNGHVEMAAAFTQAGFVAVDVHMSDLLNQTQKLTEFKGLAACGGFSYGDVLGAGRGWAQSILMHDNLREEFAKFFMRTDTFTLGVCNGCQMLSQLTEIIPGSAHWPRFVRNISNQFEARLALIEIVESPSLFFRSMHGTKMPVVVSHGEGLAKFHDKPSHVAMRYVDADHNATEKYPLNPNGSANGATGFTTVDGRVTIMMPHPERVFLNRQFSYREHNEHYSPWFKLFVNAREWVR